MHHVAWGEKITFLTPLHMASTAVTERTNWQTTWCVGSPLIPWLCDVPWGSRTSVVCHFWPAYVAWFEGGSTYPFCRLGVVFSKPCSPNQVRGDIAPTVSLHCFLFHDVDLSSVSLIPLEGSAIDILTLADDCPSFLTHCPLFRTSWGQLLFYGEDHAQLIPPAGHWGSGVWDHSVYCVSQVPLVDCGNAPTCLRIMWMLTAHGRDHIGICACLGQKHRT